MPTQTHRVDILLARPSSATYKARKKKKKKKRKKERKKKRKRKKKKKKKRKETHAMASKTLWDMRFPFSSHACASG